VSQAPQYQFLSWVRDGLASAIDLLEDVGSAAGPAHSTLSSTVNLNGVSLTVPDLSMLGPGDVTGFDRAQIVRMFPQPNISDAESTMFPLIEFDRPDLPWLATPRRAGDDRLRPWICLVVVDLTSAQVALEARPRVDGQVLVAPASELPDPTALHLWAHAQVLLTSGETVEQALSPTQGDPRRTVSRLVCPRLLRPFTRYQACVVPTFKATCDAILKKRPRTDDLAPSWTPGEAAAELPVLASWRFSTGEAGSFEELVDRLHGNPLPAGVGQRAMDVSRDSALPAAGENAVVQLESALRALDQQPRQPWPKNPGQANFRVQLAAAVSAGGAAPEDVDEPLVAPPLYGGAFWHTTTIDPTGQNWTDELNADPRERVAASLGTTVIQREQEALMERAWRQLADHQAAERERQRGLFARAVGSSMWSRHLDKLDAERSFMLTTPAHGRIAGVSTNTTVTGAVRPSLLPNAADSMAFRRALRVRGEIAARIVRLHGAAAGAPFTRHIAQIATTGLAVPYSVPDGILALRSDPRDLFSGAARSRINDVFVNHGVDGVQALSASITTNARLAAPSADVFSSRAALPDLGADLTLAQLPELARARLSVEGGGVAEQLVTSGFALQRDDGTIFAAPRDTSGMFVPVSITSGHVSLLAASQSVQVPFAQSDRNTLVENVLAPQTSIALAGAGGFARATLQTRPVSTAAFVEGTFDAQVQAPIQQIAGTVQAGDAWHGVAIASIGEISISSELINQTRPIDAAGVSQALAAWAGQQTVSLSATPGVTLAAFSSIIDTTPAVVAASLASTVAVTLEPWRTATVPARPAFALADNAAAARVAIHPVAAIGRYLQNRMALDPELVLEPPMWTPTFPDAMWKALSDISNDWILAGLERIPPNTVTLAQSNDRFTEGYLVGLNHEIAREMVWREFPTDRRGTCFQSFWGVTIPDPLPPHAPQRQPEIEQIAAQSWSGGMLGEHKPAAAGVDAPLVLVIRGDLLRRYPGTIVFAVPSDQRGGADFTSPNIKQPVFGGPLGDEYRFLGFDLDAATARSERWWFVFAEQPTEPRFGLRLGPNTWDTALPYQPPQQPDSNMPEEIRKAAAWNDAAWSNAVNHAEFVAGRHAPAQAPNLVLNDKQLDPAAWGTFAADNARICFRQPVRASVSALSMLPETPSVDSPVSIIAALSRQQLLAFRPRDG